MGIEISFADHETALYALNSMRRNLEQRNIISGDLIRLLDDAGMPGNFANETGCKIEIWSNEDGEFMNILENAIFYDDQARSEYERLLERKTQIEKREREKRSLIQPIIDDRLKVENIILIPEDYDLFSDQGKKSIAQLLNVDPNSIIDISYDDFHNIQITSNSTSINFSPSRLTELLSGYILLIHNRESLKVVIKEAATPTFLKLLSEKCEIDTRYLKFKKFNAVYTAKCEATFFKNPISRSKRQQRGVENNSQELDRYIADRPNSRSAEVMQSLVGLTGKRV
jgi:hypothetical protein